MRDTIHKQWQEIPWIAAGSCAIYKHAIDRDRYRLKTSTAGIVTIPELWHRCLD